MDEFQYIIVDTNNGKLPEDIRSLGQNNKLSFHFITSNKKLGAFHEIGDSNKQYYTYTHNDLRIKQYKLFLYKESVKIPINLTKDFNILFNTFTNAYFEMYYLLYLVIDRGDHESIENLKLVLSGLDKLKKLSIAYHSDNVGSYRKEKINNQQNSNFMDDIYILSNVIDFINEMEDSTVAFISFCKFFSIHGETSNLDESNDIFYFFIFPKHSYLFVKVNDIGNVFPKNQGFTKLKQFFKFQMGDFDSIKKERNSWVKYLPFINYKFFNAKQVSKMSQLIDYIPIQILLKTKKPSASSLKSSLEKSCLSLKYYQSVFADVTYGGQLKYIGNSNQNQYVKDKENCKFKYGPFVNNKNNSYELYGVTIYNQNEIEFFIDAGKPKIIVPTTYKFVKAQSIFLNEKCFKKVLSKIQKFADNDKIDILVKLLKLFKFNDIDVFKKYWGKDENIKNIYNLIYKEKTLQELSQYYYYSIFLIIYFDEYTGYQDIDEIYSNIARVQLELDNARLLYQICYEKSLNPKYSNIIEKLQKSLENNETAISLMIREIKLMKKVNC